MDVAKGVTGSSRPGVMAPEAPVQENLQNRAGFLLNDYLLTPAAEFDVHARVLSRRDYKRGREAELSPVDFALGWKRMSDEDILDKIKIRQTHRFYMWEVDRFPIPRKEIETSSANMHMIPASEQIRSRMDQVKNGDIIHFEG